MFGLNKFKLILAALIGILVLTACSEDEKKTDNEILLPTSAKYENALNFNEIKISSIKIKDLRTGQDSILIKDGIVREFCDFIRSMNFTKTSEKWTSEYEAEIFEGGESVLKLVFSGKAISFSEKVIIGNTVLESGDYELDNWISDNVRFFYYGKVLDPQHIETPATISLPGEISSVNICDKGSRKINQYEVYAKLYNFLEENFLNRKFEIIYAEKIYSRDLMEQNRQNAMKNCRSLIFENPQNFIEINSDSRYTQLISVSNYIVAEDLERTGIYRLYTDKMIIDIRADDKFVNGFNDIFGTNAKEEKSLTPDEIEALFNEKPPYYMDYICNNLNIESWNGREPNRLEKHKKVLNTQEKPYTVLEFYNNFDLRILFFKEDKFIDYIDYGHRSAGTEYRLEKAGDNVFIVGRICRDHGIGLDRNFEEWYLLSDNGKKLVLGFPYLDFTQPGLWGYELIADNIKFNTGSDMSLTVDYTIRKFYNLDIDIDDDLGNITIEGKKRVIFKWDDEKSEFVSEYDKNEMGMFEIPPESDDITVKCTELLKDNYQRLIEIMSSSSDTDDLSVKYMKDSWRDFLNSCEDCEEKSKLLEIIDK